jgi:hypothetical protein
MIFGEMETAWRAVKQNYRVFVDETARLIREFLEGTINGMSRADLLGFLRDEMPSPEGGTWTLSDALEQLARQVGRMKQAAEDFLPLVKDLLKLS